MVSVKLARTFIVGAMTVAIGTAVLAADGNAARYGAAAAESTAQRTIELHPDTRYANVEQGETVKFVSQGKSFAWNFDTLDTRSFELAKIAPPDIHVGNVMVYVSRNRWYSGH